MNKFIDQLEKNVQWAVLGLAVLWLGLMGWSYVMTPPATANLNGKTLMPGEVDPEIEQSVIALLQQSMNDPSVPPVRVQPMAEAWIESMRWGNTRPVELADGWMSSKPTEFELNRVMDEPGAIAENVRRVRLNFDTVAAPTPLRLQSGRSIVQPDLQGGLQPVAARGGVAWVTPSFEISMDALKEAFTKARLPDDVASTAFIDVDLYREERLPDGNWGNVTIVMPYAYGTAVIPFPQEGDVGGAAAYSAWAQGNTESILQPQFAPVNQGKDWIRPDDSAADSFDPKTYKGPLDALTPTQRAAAIAERQKQYKAGGGSSRTARRGDSRSGRTSGRGGGPSPYGGPGAEFMQAMIQAQEAQQAAQARMQAGNIGAMGPVTPARAPRVNAKNAGGLPIGDFKPAQWSGKSKIVVWANDITVEPGKTYRYALSYKIKNPLFQAAAFAQDPGMADVLAINSERSEWSQPITISETLNFYVASGKPLAGRDRIRFEVFAWNQGKNASKTFEVAPGDPVGARTSDGNFATGWTLVDVRADTSDIVLVNNEGEVMIRNYQQDQADPNYRELKQEVDAAKETRADARP